jgi:hypothetical protein
MPASDRIASASYPMSAKGVMQQGLQPARISQ